MPSFSPNELYELSVFLAIVRYRSFRKAADQMDVTASALSHRIRRLEERLGVRLLNRTSRSVVPTAAGLALAEKIAAGLDIIELGLDQLQGLSRTATGSVRINVMHDAATLLICPILPVFAERFPHIEIEVTVDDHFVDVTAEGFDAGIRYSGTIPEDMIAAPLSPALKWVVVGSPDYLARKGRPKAPEELLNHKCIRIRTGRGQIYKWEFERGEDQPADRRSRPFHLRRHGAVDSRGARWPRPLLLPRKAGASLRGRGATGDRARRVGVFRSGLRLVLFEPPSGAARHPRADRGDPRSSAARLSALRLVLGRRGKRRGRVKHEEHPRNSSRAAKHAGQLRALSRRHRLVDTLAAR